MGFLDFAATPPVLTPAQEWVAGAQALAKWTVNTLVNSTRQTYTQMWLDKDTNPTGPIENIAALGTGAAAAFQAHAASVTYLLTVLPLFDGTADLIAEAKGWQIPEGWTITFNADGSATATPPAA